MWLSRNLCGKDLKLIDSGFNVSADFRGSAFLDTLYLFLSFSLSQSFKCIVRINGAQGL